MLPGRRLTLPRLGDRLRLGGSDLQVSPFCLGMTESPETVIAAYESGLNFFFLSSDLHWPLYEPTRRGLAKLVEGNASRRRELVVAVVSYLEEPLFRVLQVHEVIDAIPGLGYVDVLIAGAVCDDRSMLTRLHPLLEARQRRHFGACAIGATFHQRSCALAAVNHELFDIVFSRYNASHPMALVDFFPGIRHGRRTVVFNFKSAMPRLTREILTRRWGSSYHWLPEPADHYRFALTRSELDGILCSPSSPAEVQRLASALEEGPLTPEQEEHMIALAGLAYQKVFQ
jgi:hypothetical protein